MAVKLAYNRVEQFSDGAGNPYSGAKLFTYVGGSVNTKQTTYTESTGSTANTNPIILDALGQLPQPVWLTTGVLYKFVLAPATDTDPPTSPYWSLDNIDGINDSSTTFDQWVTGPIPTFVGATSFTLVGDQTSTFHVGRRLKSTNTSGTIYSTITASVFGAGLTTVTVVNDSGALDAGLSAVSYGILSDTNSSIPGFQSPGDLLSLSAAGTISRIAVGAAGTVLISRPAATSKIAYVAALNKAIYGLTYDVGTDTVNDWNINTGGAMDATGAYWLTLATALGKQSDVAWAVGGTTAVPAGALDTGAVGNNDYYIWLIARSDTGVVDALFSLSSTTPVMPAQYDFKRLIGWFKRVGGTIVAAHTYETEGGGLEMNWDVPTLDINLANTLTTARRTDPVKVPLNFSVTAKLNVTTVDAAGSTEAWVYCPDQTDAAPSPTAAPLGNVRSTGAAVYTVTELMIRTSSAGLIAARCDVATMDLYAVVTIGFRWARRN